MKNEIIILLCVLAAIKGFGWGMDIIIYFQKRAIKNRRYRNRILEAMRDNREIRLTGTEAGQLHFNKADDSEMRITFAKSSDMKHAMLYYTLTVRCIEENFDKVNSSLN